MLVLVAVIALAAGAAVHDVQFAQQLADAPQRDSGVVHPGPTPAEQLHVTLRPGARRVPAGFSAGRFIAQDYEIQSTGHSARGSRRTLVQGVTRLETSVQDTP